MAVFVDKIVMKTSSDPEATILADIAVGGPDEITPGELVVGLTPGTARLYTLDSNNSVVSLGGTAATSLAGLSDVDVTTNPPTPNQSLAYDATSGNWVPSTPVVGASQLSDLSDVDLATNGLAQGYYLRYDSVAAQFLSISELGPISDHSNVDATSPTNGQSLVYNSSTGNWEPGIPNIVGLAAVQDDTVPVLGGDLFLDSYSISNDTNEIVFESANTNGGTLVLKGVVSGQQTFAINWQDSSGASILSLKASTNADRNPYTLTLPPEAGNTGYVLTTTNSYGTTTWSDGRLQAETAPALGANFNTSDYYIHHSSSGDGINFHGYKLSETLDQGIDQEAALKLWDKYKNNYVKITVSPSIGQDWSLKLPDNPGSTGYVLTTDGSGNTSWSIGPAANLSSTSIDELSDVDTTTSAPSTNEALIWDGTNWVPGTAAANVTGNSIDDFGDVNITAAADNDVLVYNSATSKWENEQRGIQDGRDYALEVTTATVFRFSYGSAVNSGEWEVVNTLSIDVNNTTADSVDFQAYMLAFSGTYPSTFSVSTTGAEDSFTTVPLTTVVNGGTQWTLASDTVHGLSSSGFLYLTLESPPATVALADDYVLTWDASVNKFVPKENLSGTLDYNQLNNKPDIPSSIDDLSDVDTATTAPLTGQVLEWSGTEWVPGDGQSIDAVSAINGETGRVFLGIRDMVDYGDANQPGREFSYNTNIGESGAAYSQEGVWGPANGGNDLLISTTAIGGVDMLEIIALLPSSGSMWIYSSLTSSWAGPASYTSITENYLSTGAINFAGVGAYFNSAQGTDIKVAFNDPTTTATVKSDMDIISWRSSKNRFEATAITSVSGGTFGSGV